MGLTHFTKYLVSTKFTKTFLLMNPNRNKSSITPDKLNRQHLPHVLPGISFLLPSIKQNLDLFFQPKMQKKIIKDVSKSL